MLYHNSIMVMLYHNSIINTAIRDFDVFMTCDDTHVSYSPEENVQLSFAYTYYYCEIQMLMLTAQYWLPSRPGSCEYLFLSNNNIAHKMDMTCPLVE
jgi:hypothetical protein